MIRFLIAAGLTGLAGASLAQQPTPATPKDQAATTRPEPADTGTAGAPPGQAQDIQHDRITGGDGDRQSRDVPNTQAQPRR